MAKSLDELRGTFQTFPEAFKERFGRKVTKSEIIKTIKARIRILEEAQLKTIFDSYDVITLKSVLDQINTDQWEAIEDDLKVYNGPVNVDLKESKLNDISAINKMLDSVKDPFGDLSKAIPKSEDIKDLIKTKDSKKWFK